MPLSCGLPLITVVMPIYNEGRFISETLEQLLEQDYPKDKLEILVVDGLSNDDTAENVRKVAANHSNIKLLQNPRRKSSAGRNIGFKQGRGDYFVVIDGHCFIPTRNLLRNIADSFYLSGADCLGRPQQLNPPGLTSFQEAVALARSAKIGHSGASYIYSDFEGFISPTSNGAAYCRKVLDKVGYVDESFDAAEDVEFNYRVEKAGFRCFTSPGLHVKYYPRENIGALFKQLTRYGKGRCRFLRKHPEAFTLNQLIPLMFVIGLFVALASASVFMVWPGIGVFMILPGILYIVYLGIILATSVQACYRSGWKYLRFLPLIFFTIHFALGWGFLLGFFQGKGK